ncbi:YesL family protein [Jeotgalibacillus haloalkalitolerans]|uniref:YesL family protein n=1 Tax=Jeotgalibacillus haloalkalitolerans TaxID=3104292 RepID=A0ABU5KK12_9BACL|nr:YesL family protein [Jeotgalibacillus sp. HH7-29]MDZ5711418.1 YesL family protein [Jeotgalibacillus sp. HH7-29]
MFTRIGGFFTEASLWIFRMMQLNLTWLIHIVLGGVITGFFPATVALFSITRSWVKGDIDEPVWTSFHRCFKNNFMKSNALGAVYAAVGGFIYLDLYLALQMKGAVGLFLTILLIVVAALFILSLLTFFAYYVHFEQTYKAYLIQPFILTFISFRQNLLIVIGLTLIGYLLKEMPGLIPFAAGVMPAYWIMKVSMNRYRQLKIEMEAVT